MGPFEMVVAIVLIVAIAKVWKAKHRGVAADGDGVARKENDQLRDEVRRLKERLAVIERITVEKENSLEREIERLRDPR